METGRPSGILPSNVDVPAASAPPAWRAVQSPLLVGALVFVTFGLYAFWWLGRTWWQIKRETDNPRMHPVWHVLAMLVPIYGYFRFYAHMRAIAALAATPEARAAVSPGAATLAWIIINVLDGVASLPSSAMWVTLVGSALGGGLFGYAQNGLNAAWQSRPGGTVNARSHPLHYLLLLCGGLLLLVAVVIGLGPETA